MIHRLLTLASLAALGPIAQAHAQDRPLPALPQSLSLAEALDLAMQYSPLYRQVRNNRAPAAWGVRNALASAFLPSLSASGSLGYTGPGSQTFLTQEFVQPSATLGSSYSLGLSWQLSGRTLSQPALARAQLSAADADLTSSRMTLRSTIVNQYLAVLQAQENVRLAEVQQTRAEEALRLAQARYQVGQTTVLDVRQAEVQRGRAAVAVLQAQQAVTVEKLRLFQQMGVAPPEDPNLVTLSDTLPVVEPNFNLSDLLAEAERQNPDLSALKAREAAARWNERAAKSGWLPNLSFSAGWSGFTQQFTDAEPLVQNAITAAQNAARSDALQCQYVNTALLNPGQVPLPCPSYPLPTSITDSIAQSVRARNSVFPFHFTRQPFQARLSVSLPLFTQFSRPFQVSEAAAQADDAREQVRARALQVRTEVSQAYYGLQTAYRSIGIQETNRAAARDQIRLATEQYRVGSGTFLNVLDAQAQAQQAEADYVRAVYDYHRAMAQLETAVGRPLR